MPRANRYFIPGSIWHITHRCHKREFLLKFDKDKKRWYYWLYQAKKRFKISILNFCITSNHIHLLLTSSGSDSIAKGMQLIAGRTAFEFNSRKNRSGAFWEDRYHATAIESGKYLLNCLAYIDLNMVRAGIVKHPKDWKYCGYRHYFFQPQRYALIAYKKLLELTNFETIEEFQKFYNCLLEEKLEKENQRAEKWTTSIALGSENFIRKFKAILGEKAFGRKLSKENDIYTLKEEIKPYNTFSSNKKNTLRQENLLFWNCNGD